MAKKQNEEGVFKGSEVMMMLESMNDGIQIIAEGHQTLLEGQKKLKQEIQGVRTELEEFRAEVNQKFDSIFDFLSSIEDEMVSLRKEIDILKATKADDERVVDLDSRLAVLEKEFKMMQEAG